MVKRLEALLLADRCFLAMSTVAEFLGMCHALAFINREDVQLRLRDFTLANGPFAFVLVLLLYDCIQYPFHVVGQLRFCYPFGFKQHRRQLVPFRGYADAANKHPLEIMLASAALTTSLSVVHTYIGLHFGCVLMIAMCLIVFDFLHHLPFNSKLHFPLPYPTFARDHQMHHRLRKCNHGTVTSICDRIVGTWEVFKALDEPVPEPVRPLMWYEKTKDPAELDPVKPGPMAKAGRPDFFPSPWSILVSLSILISITLSLEIYQSGELPEWHDILPFARPVIVVFNVGLFCFAVEHACANDVVPKKTRTRLYTKPTMKEADPNALQEAVRPGHHKKMTGGKDVYKPKLSDAVQP